jgi:hypothetical protein
MVAVEWRCRMQLVPWKSAAVVTSDRVFTPVEEETLVGFLAGTAA